MRVAVPGSRIFRPATLMLAAIALAVFIAVGCSSSGSGSSAGSTNAPVASARVQAGQPTMVFVDAKW